MQPQVELPVHVPVVPTESTKGNFVPRADTRMRVVSPKYFQIGVRGGLLDYAILRPSQSAVEPTVNGLYESSSLKSFLHLPRASTTHSH